MKIVIFYANADRKLAEEIKTNLCNVCNSDYTFVLQNIEFSRLNYNAIFKNADSVVFLVTKPMISLSSRIRKLHRALISSDLPLVIPLISSEDISVPSFFLEYNTMSFDFDEPSRDIYRLRYVIDTEAMESKTFRTKSNKLTMLITRIAIILGALGVLLSILFWQTDVISSENHYYLLLIFVGLILFASYGYYIAKKENDSKVELSEFSKKLKPSRSNMQLAPEKRIINSKSPNNSVSNIIQEVSSDEKAQQFDTQRLYDVLYREMKQYYSISRNQAGYSFALAIAMCVLGFLLFAGAVIIPLTSKVNADVSNSISIIAVISGTVVELFAGTTMLVYRSALIQLNRYYDSIHLNERFYSCINIVPRLSTTDKRDAMIEEILREEIKKAKPINFENMDLMDVTGNKKPDGSADDSNKTNDGGSSE